MSLPTSSSPSVKLKTLLNLELNGEINLNTILNDLRARCAFNFKIISAQLEYSGNANFGQMVTDDKQKGRGPFPGLSCRL